MKLWHVWQDAEKLKGFFFVEAVASANSAEAAFRMLQKECHNILRWCPESMAPPEEDCPQFDRKRITVTEIGTARQEKAKIWALATGQENGA